MNVKAQTASKFQSSLGLMGNYQGLKLGKLPVWLQSTGEQNSFHSWCLMSLSQLFADFLNSDTSENSKYLLSLVVMRHASSSYRGIVSSVWCAGFRHRSVCSTDGREIFGLARLILD